MTTMTAYWTPTEAQVKLIEDMYKERYNTDSPNYREVWSRITTLAALNPKGFQQAVNWLKLQPKLVKAAPSLPALASEPGLYRDPSDGTLYKIGKTKNSWDTKPVSVYSLKANKVHRLTEAGELVKVEKGTWDRKPAGHARALTEYTYSEQKGTKPVTGVKILDSWLMTEEDKVRYQTGMCNFCTRGLTDGRSVKRNYGPDCAERYGLPWGD